MLVQRVNKLDRRLQNHKQVACEKDAPRTGSAEGREVTLTSQQT